MEFLLGASARAGDVGALTAAYADYERLREEMMWRDRRVSTQQVHGVDILRSVKDSGRGAILNQMHHGLFWGAAASFGLRGLSSHAAGAAAYFDDLEGPWGRRRQALMKAICQHGVTCFNATRSFDHMVELLKAGELVVLYHDLPGSTTAAFLGRTVSAASGVARLSLATGAPVVPITAAPDGQLTAFTAEDPIEPGDFGDVASLQAELFRRHEPAVLAWPEAVQTPTRRWLIAPSGG